MSIDRSTHSLFGASKAAADLLVQEYGRYFEMPTVCFRAGCLTGPQHAGAQLHGFLAYLMKCTVTGTPYTVFGYGGKQVRDNLHSADLVACFEAFHRNPRAAAVYNIGGGRESNCSMLEAIEACERIAGRELQLGALGGEPDRRPPLVDLGSGRVPARLSRLGAAQRDRGDPAADPRPQRRALDGGRGMKLSVVIPARGEEGSVGADAREDGRRARARGDRLRADRRRRPQQRSDGRDRRRDRRREPARSLRASSSYEPGFGLAVRAGLDAYTGDAVAVMMADGSDHPEDLVRYHARARGGLGVRLRLPVHPRGPGGAAIRG